MGRNFSAHLFHPPVVSVIVLFFCILWNWQFVLPQAQNGLMESPDVKPLIQGFYDTPHLFPDSLRWWHGTWQYPDTPRFRPFSGYLYWVECWLGIRYGWVSAAYINFVLFVICCLTTKNIVQQFTNSPLASLLAGVLAAGVHFFNSHTPFWLIWFPNAYNLLTAIFWLNALLLFDRWHECADEKRNVSTLVSASLCFLAACLSLESAWMFPLMAFLVALLRPATCSRRYSFTLCFLMCGAVLFLAWYRALVVPQSQLPSSNSTNFGSIFFVAHPLISSILTSDWALLALTGMIGALCLKNFRDATSRWACQRAKPIVWLAVISICIAILFAASPNAIFFAYRLARDPLGHATSIFYMLLPFFFIFLIWRYGNQFGKTWIVALLLPPLAFLPTLPYMHAHWHYTFTPWFFLCIFYGTLFHLAELHFQNRRAI